MTVLNAIICEVIDEVATRLESISDKGRFEEEVDELVREYFMKHDRVVFDGNGYADSWIEEAERRGLPHIRTTPEALEVLGSDKTIALMEKYSILSRSEMVARQEIQIGNHEKTLDIEAKTCLNMVETIYIPVIAQQLEKLCDSLSSVQRAGLQIGQGPTLEKTRNIATLYDELPAQLQELRRVIKEEQFNDMRPAMDKVRATIDALESQVEAKLWPVPTYAQMLNIHSK